MSITIKAKIPEQDRIIEVEKNLGDTLAEASQLFGEEAVFSCFLDTAIIRIQSMMRTMARAKSPHTDEEIQAAVSDYNFAGRSRVSTGPRKSKMERIKETFLAASADDRAKMLAELRAMLGQE